MPIVPDHDSAEVTVRESAKAAATDLAELAAVLPGGAQAARVADRLSEELAELGQMIRSLPARPVVASGHDWQLLAALRSAHAAGEDVAETIARACARLGWELGSTYAVISNRDSSWEAGHVAELLRGTVGDDLGVWRVMTGALADRDAQIRAIGEEFPGWEAWQGLVNGLWHARQTGTTPPVMVHAESPEELREQIRFRIGAS